MEKTSFSSRVESLHEEHPFRVIFEKTRRNFAHLDINPQTVGRIYIDSVCIPYRSEDHDAQLTASVAITPQKLLWMDVDFQQAKLDKRVKVDISILLDGFWVDYSDKGSFSRTLAWYKNGAIRLSKCKSSSGDGSDMLVELSGIIDWLEPHFIAAGKIPRG